MSRARVDGGHLVEHRLWHLVDAVRLVASELATNAVVHASTGFVVTLEVVDDTVMLTVRDGGAPLPAHAVTPAMHTSGRGLDIVDCLTRDWGINEEAGGSKAVWASFDTAEPVIQQRAPRGPGVGLRTSGARKADTPGMTCVRFEPDRARVDGSGRRREDGTVSVRTPGEEAVVAALCEALTPYSWRRFTPALLVRFALAVRDRQELTAVLSGLRGAAVGTWDRLEPADRSDARVARLVGSLADLRWAEASLRATCGTLAAVLAPDLR